MKNNNNNNQTNAQRKQELRARIRNMQDARRGKQFKQQQQNSSETSSSNQQQKHLESKSIDALLKQLNIDQYTIKLQLQQAFQKGQISNVQDLAKFLTEKTKLDITENDILTKLQGPPPTPTFTAPPISTNQETLPNDKNDNDNDNNDKGKKKKIAPPTNSV